MIHCIVNIDLVNHCRSPTIRTTPAPPSLMIAMPAPLMSLAFDAAVEHLPPPQSFKECCCLACQLTFVLLFSICIELCPIHLTLSPSLLSHGFMTFALPSLVTQSQVMGCHNNWSVAVCGTLCRWACYCWGTVVIATTDVCLCCCS